MKTEPTQPDPESDWRKTPFANLIRYEPSQTYFARIRVKGKLIRRSLKTKTLTVAKLRLADFEKNQRNKTRSTTAVHQGKMKFGDALNVYCERLQNNPAIKPGTKVYYQYRIKALLKSWPDLKFRDVTQITPAECAAWSAKNARISSSSSHNHTVSVLRHVFQIAVENGARYDNPAGEAKRIQERTQKRTELPASAEFQKLVAEIRSSGSGFARPAADLVEFLAYGGFRKSEAAHITWADCDFSRGKIVVKGDPTTGLKGRHAGESREIPMIPDMRTLLEQIKTDRPSEMPTTKIMRVSECQKSIDRAVKILGIRRLTHHDLRHLFATRCIESGVDIPTVSRWLGHIDGGAMAMKVYGYLRDEHSTKMAQKVTFLKAPGVSDDNLPQGHLTGSESQKKSQAQPAIDAAVEAII